MCLMQTDTLVGLGEYIILGGVCALGGVYRILVIIVIIYKSTTHKITIQISLQKRKTIM